MAIGRAGFGKFSESREATFGAGAPGGVFTDAKHKGPLDGMLVPFKNIETDEAIRQSDVTIGAKQGLLHADFDLTFHLWQTTSTPPVAAYVLADMPFVARLTGEFLGQEVVGGFTTMTAAAQAVDTLTVVASATFYPGQAIMVEVGAATPKVWEISFITEIPDATHIKVAPSFSAAPTSSTTVYGSYTAAQLNNGKFAIAASSHAFRYTSPEYKWDVQRKGCRPRTMGIKENPRDFGEMTFGFSSAIYDDDTALVALPAESTFSRPLLPLAEGRFILANTAYAIKSSEYSGASNIVPVLDPSSRTTEAIQDYVVGAARSSKWTVVLYLDNSAELHAQPFQTYYKNQTPVQAMLSFAKGPGYGYARQFGQARIAEKPVYENTDGLATVKLVLEPGLLTTDVATIGEGAGDTIINTPQRAAWL